MNKKALFLACVIALSLCFTACSDDNKSSTDTQANAVSDTTTTEPTAATTTEPTTEATTTTEQVDTRVFREYDTYFDIKEGETVYFEGGSIAFESREVMQHSFDGVVHDTTLKYSLWVNDKEYLSAVSAIVNQPAPHMDTLTADVEYCVFATKIDYDSCTVMVTKNSSQNDTSSVTTSTAQSPKPDSPPTGINPALIREYNEEFEVRVGDVAYFDEGRVALKITEISEEDNEFGNHFIHLKYTTFVNGKAYPNMLYTYDNKPGPYFESDSMGIAQRLVATKITSDSCTVKMTLLDKVADPITLSGNSNAWYTAPENVYIETDDYNIYIMEGITVRESIKEEIDTYIDIVSDKTGYDLFVDTEFFDPMHGEHTWVFGDSFVGIGADKFAVYLVPYTECGACATSSLVVVNPENQSIIDDSAASTFLHELTHACHAANGIFLNDIMTEGYATYMADVLLKEHPEYDCDFNSEFNYSFISFDITPQNAKEMFMTELENSHDYYCYGYRFVNYLFEAYDQSIFRDIVAEATKHRSETTNVVDSQVTYNAVIKNTSETVFEDFANWLSQNEDRFDGI